MSFDRAFACLHVARGGQPVAFVARDAGGTWELYCGAEHADPPELAPIAFEPLAERQPSLRTLADLPPGGTAELRDWGWLKLTAPASYGDVAGRGCASRRRG